jgi:hypothetical protein
MLPWPAVKPGASGSSRPPRCARPTVQYFSCTRCATATNTSAASSSPAGRSMSYASVMGPEVELVDLVGGDLHLPELRDHVPQADRPAAPIVRNLVPPRPQARSPQDPR